MATEKKPRHMSWIDFAELKIREAQDEGQFAHLPGFGQPIAGLDDPYDDQWWIKDKLKREGLSVLPPSLEIKRDVEKTLQAIARLTCEREVRAVVDALNIRIRDANLRSVNGPPSTQLSLETNEIVRLWRDSSASS